MARGGSDHEPFRTTLTSRAHVEWSQMRACKIQHSRSSPEESNKSNGMTLLFTSNEARSSTAYPARVLFIWLTNVPYRKVVWHCGPNGDCTKKQYLSHAGWQPCIKSKSGRNVISSIGHQERMLYGLPLLPQWSYLHCLRPSLGASAQMVIRSVLSFSMSNQMSSFFQSQGGYCPPCKLASNPCMVAMCILPTVGKQGVKAIDIRASPLWTFCFFLGPTALYES